MSELDNKICNFIKSECQLSHLSNEFIKQHNAHYVVVLELISNKGLSLEEDKNEIIDILVKH